MALAGGLAKKKMAGGTYRDLIVEDNTFTLKFGDTLKCSLAPIPRLDAFADERNNKTPTK
jgi:hypothetical protein